MEESRYDELAEGWSNVLNALSEDVRDFELETVKKLIYDTYHYYKETIGNSDKVERKNLVVYKCVGQLGYYLGNNNIDGISESVTATCADFLLGLCYVIEDTFDTGYGKNPLPLGVGEHTLSGGADPEADMTSYEAFEKAFEENVEMLRQMYDLE